MLRDEFSDRQSTPPPQLTDLNERERMRFAEGLRELAKMATDAADGIETRQDDKFMMAFLPLTILVGPVLAQISKDVASAIRADAKSEWPDHINTNP